MTRTKKLATVSALAALWLMSGRGVWALGRQSSDGTVEVRGGRGVACPAQRVPAVLEKASSLMEQARYRDAAEALQSSERRRCDARISLLLAAALEASGDREKARETLEGAHAVWPTNNSIAASLARDYLGGGQTGKAVQALDHFHATDSTPQQEMELAVVTFLAGHRLRSAEALSLQVYKSHPSAQSLLLLANTVQLEGRYKEVISLLEPQRKVYADSPAFLITLAESESDAEIYNAAREDLERAISLDPESYQGHYLLGNVMFKLGQVDKAEAEYRKAIKLAPDQPRTYYQLALALRTRQDDEGEAGALARALMADAHYAPAHCEMGRLLLSENRPADAVEQLNLAIGDNPGSEDAYYLLARAYFRLGEKDKSEAMVKRLALVRSGNRRATQVDNHLPPRSDRPASQRSERATRK